MNELSPESKARIALVRSNELSPEELTYDELEGLLSPEDKVTAPQPEKVATAPSTEDGGSNGTTGQPDTATEGEKARRTKKEIADEANHYKQLWDNLPGKLQRNPEFRKQWLEDNKLTSLVVPETETRKFDKGDLYSPENVELLIASVEELKAEKALRDKSEARTQAEDRVFGAIDELIADLPELAPKAGSWRKLNDQNAKAYEKAGNDLRKLEDPEFVKSLAEQGIQLPTDPNYLRLCAINQIAHETGLNVRDAYAVWKGRNPESVPVAVSASASEPKSDRATTLLGSGGVASGTGVAPLGLNERLANFSARCGSRMDRLSVLEEAEWAGIEAELVKVSKR